MRHMPTRLTQRCTERCRRSGPGVAVVAAACLVLAVYARVTAQPASLSETPFGDPIVRADALLGADRATHWEEDGAKMLLLEGAVTVEIGTYGFRANRAVVRTDLERRPGRQIRHLSLYLENARPLRGTGRVSAEASRLLVTASTTGQVRLRTHLLNEAATTPSDELVQAASRRTQSYRLALAGPALALPDGAPLIDPQAEQIRSVRRGQIEQELAARQDAALDALEQAAPRPTASPRDARMPEPGFIPDDGVLIVDWGQYAYREAEGVLVLSGGVRVAYQNFRREVAVTLTCQNAVIFLNRDADAPGERPEDPSQLRAGDIAGIYLEDNAVVTDGTYTIRAPRVFYSPATEKAMVLDAVFYTWDERHQIPIYMRAEKLRQLSARTWTAENALVTTSEFAEPHFAIATDRVRFDLQDDAEGRPVARVETSSIVPQVGDLPVGWFPGMSGTATDIPLRRAQVGYSGRNGPRLETRWDMFALLGMERPQGVDLVANFDYLGDHGPGIGGELDYTKPNLFGTTTAYLLPYDNGEDHFGGRKVDHDGETRGFLHWQHRQQLQDHWEISLELAYVSDPTFLEEFFRAEAETSKPYETSIYVKRQEQDAAFTFLAQYDLLDFTAQTPALQAPGYTVEKLPELGYYRVGTSLLDDRLTYFTENRAGRMRIRGGEDDPRDRGFSTFESMINFGIPRTTDFEDALEMAGVPSSYVNRLDSRHELQAPLKIGFLDVVPYVAGRVTFYDDDFEEFAGEDENTRLWGAVGTRFHAAFSRAYDDVSNQLLDVHRLRHIVEPSVDLQLSGANLDPEDIPVYDPEVEGIREGSSGRFGLRNTLQTQRGGQGRWRSVDWLVVNTDVVLRSDDTDIETEPARYFSYRPEYGTGGDHFYADLAWMVSDSFALRGDVTQSLESGETSQWHIGAVLTHSQELSWYLEYEEIEPIDSRLLSAGFTYRLAPKYRLGVNQRWNLEKSQSQRTEFVLERKLPRWTLMLVASVDNVDHDQSIGIVLIPDGISSSRLLGPWGQ